MKNLLNHVLEKVKPTDKELDELKIKAMQISDYLKSKIKKSKIPADVFIGGSFAKNTLIKKKKYDVDIFVRFDKTFPSGELPSLLKKIVPPNSRLIHGSRNYFSVKKENLDFEIIPTIKIKKPLDAENITDLSYFHVNYIKKKINTNKQLADEIRLAKAFAYYQDCYGAESYINGFSGYAIELLVSLYGSFSRFILAMAKANIKKEKLILDSEKQYKSKSQIYQEMNKSKINSPIILIDPTYKERNVLAALSDETFSKFRKSCQSFLKSPSDRFFKIKDKAIELKKRYKANLIELNIFTNRQAGDIAGTKLKKFSKFFLGEIKRYFDIKAGEFSYDDSKNLGKILLALELKKEIIFKGPPTNMKEESIKFKKAHKKIKIIKGRAFAYEKNSLDFNKWLHKFENEKSKTINKMGVSGIKRV